MAKLEQYQPQVDLSKQATPYAQVDAPAAAFGIGLGKEMVETAEIPAKIYKKEREGAAIMAAANAELEYGKAMDEIVSNFKQKGGLVPAQTIGDDQAALEQVRTRIRATLNDDLAAQRFDLATRVQTQAAYRHMNDHALNQIDQWEAGTVDGLYHQALSESVPTGDVKADIQTLGIKAQKFVPALTEFYQKRDKPQEFIAAEIQKRERALVEAMLHGYDQNPGQGLALLNAAVPGTDLSVRQILGEKAGTWESHFKGLDKEVRIEREGRLAWDEALPAATDSVTGRFDPNKAWAVLQAKPEETRALIDKDFKARVGLQVALQNQEDVQRVARMESLIRATGRLDKKHPDFTRLDDEGRAKVEAFWDTRLRTLRGDKYEARREQAAINGLAVAAYKEAFIADKAVADLSDDDLRVKYGVTSLGAVDDYGFKELVKLRTTLKENVSKNQAATAGEFYKRVDDQAKIIAKLGGDRSKEQWAQRSQRFRDVMGEWFNDGKPHTDAEVSAKIKEFVTYYDVPFGTKGNLIGTDKYGFELTAEQRAQFKANPQGDQKFEAAKAKDQIVTDGKTQYRLKAGFALPKGWTIVGDAP